MSPDTDKPVIVQSDRSILMETDGPRFEDARDSVAAFAELVKPQLPQAFANISLGLSSQSDERAACW
jgi:hypothetical protein